MYDLNGNLNWPKQKKKKKKKRRYPIGSDGQDVLYNQRRSSQIIRQIVHNETTNEVELSCKDGIDNPGQEVCKCKSRVGIGDPKSGIEDGIVG